MPKQVLFALSIESILLAMTILFLVQPLSLTRFGTPNRARVFRMGGMVLLCLTFCWSVVFGCILALNEMTLRL